MTLTKSQESPETTALHEGVESSEGLRRLGRMAAIESIDRNLENEDAAVDRDARLNDAELYGADAVNAVKPPEVDEMRIMAARDVIVHEPTPASPPPLPVSAKQPKSKLPLLAKAAITAALVGSGVGAGAAIPFLLGLFDKSPPTVVVPAAEQWTERRLENYMPPQGEPE